MVSHLTGDSSQSDRRQLMENSSQVYFLYNLSIFGKPVKILRNKSHFTNFQDLLQRNARRRVKVRCVQGRSVLETGGN